MKTEHLSKVKDTLLAENNLFKVHEPNDENNFPSDCLPPVLGDYFEELADKYDISQDLACPLGLGVISSCLGRGFCLNTYHPDPTFGLLYMIIGTRPGIAKSAVLKKMLEPLREYQANRRSDYKNSIRRRLEEESSSANVSEREIRQAIGKSLPTLITEHSTLQGLATSLSHNNEYLSLISSDAAGIVDELRGSRSKGAFQGELLLKGYGGDPYDSVLKVSENEQLESPRLSVTLACTLQTLNEFVSDHKIRGTGLLSRFLFSSLDDSLPEVSFEDKTVSEVLESRWRKLVQSLLNHSWNIEGKCLQVIMTDGAKYRFQSFENSIRSNMETYESLFGLPNRWTENALRLCLVLHVAEFAEQSHLNPLCENTACNAIKIIEWFIERELCLFDGITHDNAEELWSKVVRLLEKKGPMSRRVLRRCCNNLGPSDGLINRWTDEALLVAWEGNQGQAGANSKMIGLKDDPRLPSSIPS